MNARLYRWIMFCLTCVLLGATARPASAQISVNSANPNNAPQGSTNLIVKIGGNGFKKGASSKFFVTGTTNPGGITVNSTAFISSTEVDANITVAADASVSGFDIQVTAGDRTGKGTDLFAVIQGATPNSCAIQPVPAGVTLLGTLNTAKTDGTATFSGNLGITVAAKLMVLGGTNVLVVGVGTPNGTDAGRLEIFFLDPVTGKVLDGTAIGTNTAIQPHVTVNYSSGTSSLAVGDVNGDGIPDFIAGSKNTNGANAVVGSISGGVVSYQFFPLPIPTGAGLVGWSAAIGDIRGVGHDDIAVGSLGSGNGGSSTNGAVMLYSYDGSTFTNYLTIPDPAPSTKKNTTTDFGMGLAIGDVTGDARADLIVGAPGASTGTSARGRVYVYPAPVSATNFFVLNTGAVSDGIGAELATGDIDGDSSADGYLDVYAVASLNQLAFNGPAIAGEGASFTVQPAIASPTTLGSTPSVSDVNGDGLADAISGFSTTNSAPICNGAAYLWLSSGGVPLSNRILLSTPAAGAVNYGYAVGFAPGTRIFFVTDNRATVGSTTTAGQVYVYKVN